MSLLLALVVLKDKARPLGLEVNWQKTKVQSSTDPSAALSSVHISDNPVDVMESFIYLGSEIHSTGSSEPEVRCRIGLAKSCFNFLNRGIWRSSISLLTKVQLYHTCSQPVLLYGSETWALTRALQDKVDAFDNMCLRRILCIPYTDHVTNTMVRLQAGSLPQLSQLIQARGFDFLDTWQGWIRHLTSLEHLKSRSEGRLRPIPEFTDTTDTDTLDLQRHRY